MICPTVSCVASCRDTVSKADREKEEALALVSASNREAAEAVAARRSAEAAATAAKDEAAAAKASAEDAEARTRDMEETVRELSERAAQRDLEAEALFGVVSELLARVSATRVHARARPLTPTQDEGRVPCVRTFSSCVRPHWRLLRTVCPVLETTSRTSFFI
eukprot:5294296-Pleurochrysis_carterae.AAC.1